MSREDSAVPPRDVWVVMLDQLPLEPVVAVNGETIALDSPPQCNSSKFSAFDDLDLRSTFFEQYMVQDVRADATITDILGGIERVQQFQRCLSDASCRISHLRLICSDNPAVDQVTLHESHLCGDGSAGKLTEHIFHVDEYGADQAELEQFCGHALKHSNLVWIDVRTLATEHRLNAAESVVRWISRMRSDPQGEPAKLPVIILSSLRGFHRKIHRPFKATGDEGLVHAPLWIDSGASHACRIQKLVGSFDLLPTLAQYLTGVIPIAQKVTKNGDGSPPGLNNLSSIPLSLVNVSQSSRIEKDRLLAMTGDSWNALRSQQYLLVRSTMSALTVAAEGCENPTGADNQADRHLYLKPDDVWNVNDAIVSYAAIADEMENAECRSAT